jgi:hypothetical protein
MRLFYALSTVILVGCDFHPFLDGAPGYSRSVEESKTRNVFLTTYRPSPTSFTFKGNVFHIQTAWVERGWTHTGWRYSNTKVDAGFYADSYHFIAEVSEPSDRLADIHLQQSDNKNSHLGTSYNQLFTSGSRPLPDTLRYDLVDGMSGHDNTYLGLRLTFIKQ